MRTYFPFTDYDFWAYISAGFVFLAAVDHVLGTQWLFRESWRAGDIGLAIIAVYATGHLLAGVASALIERRIVHRWVGRPHEFLLGGTGGPRFLRRIYPAYFEALPKGTRSLLTSKAQIAGVESDGEGLFWLAFTKAKTDKAALERLSSFINQYGMCRNLTFAGILAGALLMVNARRSGDGSHDYWLGGITLFLSVGLFFRYLKFYRHYALEVLTTFAFMDTVAA